MKARIVIESLAVIVICLYGSSSVAQGLDYSQDVQLYAGQMFGDRVTNAPVDGSYPRLDDGVTFGARYTFDFTPQWGLQFSTGYSPGRLSHVVSGATDLGLTTADLDLQWNITPELALAGHRLVPYVVAGGGYAWSYLDHAIAGSVAGNTVRLNNGNGVTANAGLGARYDLYDGLFIDLDARYRYLNKLVSAYPQGLNTAEATIGFGYQF
jgi:opacity protein-like surface antigen